MKYNHILNKTINKYNNVLFKNAILFEGIEDLKRYFPKLNDETLHKLVALDPTYKGGDQLGKYGKWIIKLFYNTLKNDENKKQYQELLKQYPDGINPKTGQKFQEPVKLPSIQKEDLYKLTNSLKQYDIYKKEIGKPLDAFKTLPELDSVLSNIKNQGIPTNDLALKRYNIFKKGESKGLKKIYEDNKWIIGIPTTKESSCLFGDDTSWCTTSQGQYYDHYTKQGPLYINLNKEDGKLYQFHFETDSFMNEHDNSIDMENFSEENPQLVEFYKTYLNKKNQEETPEVKTKQIIEDKTKLKNYFEDVEITNVDDNYVYSKMRVTDIPNNGNSYLEYYVYQEPGYRNDDALSLETISNILEDGGIDNWYDETNINDLEYNIRDINFDEKMKSYNINWDTIKDIYINEYTDDLPENITNKIYELFNDVELNPVDIYRDATKIGTDDEYYKLVTNGLIDNLPLDNEQPFDGQNLNIKFPIKDITDSFKIREEEFNEEKNDYPWYKQYSFESDYYGDQLNYWLYKWRQIHYNDPEFTITEPHYGVMGFDDEFWKNGMKHFMEELITILNSNKK